MQHSADPDDAEGTPHPAEESPLLGTQPATNGDDSLTTQRPVTKIAATMISYAILGLFTSTTGVILPHLERDYGLSDSQASLIFLAVPVPYLLAAQTNSWLHSTLGRRGIAIIGPLAHASASIVASQRPPFVGFLACFSTIAFGHGLIDGSWATWAAAQDDPNFTSGLLHGAFSIGAASGPAIAGIVVLAEAGSWHAWYYYLAVASLAELAVLTWAFRSDDASNYHMPGRIDTERARLNNGGLSEVLQHRAVWLCATYLLMYVGTESAISGWIVVFMTRTRHIQPAMANLCLTGFWAGMAVGRFVLGPMTERAGVRRSVAMYLFLAMAIGTLSALSHNIAVSISLLSLLGAFCGPLFPSSIVFLASAIPGSIHVAAVSFVSSVGQIGGAGLPALVGIISEAVGIRAFQIVIMAQLAATLVSWHFLTSQRSILYAQSSSPSSTTVIFASG